MKPKSIVTVLAMALLIILLAACGEEAEPEPVVVTDAASPWCFSSLSPYAPRGSTQ